MGDFFEEISLPTKKGLVLARQSYDEVKRIVKIPSTRGAKIGGAQFVDRASKAQESKGRCFARV